MSVTLGLALCGTALVIVLLLQARATSRAAFAVPVSDAARSALVASYRCELADRRLLCSFEMVDGRTFDVELDGPFVYDLSCVFLAAATRLGAERQGVREVDPETRKPTTGLS